MKRQLLAMALAAGPVLAPMPACGQGGYGGARVVVSSVGGRSALLGGGPLAAFTFGRLTAGVLLTPSEGDADGLQLVPVGPFLEYDLTPDGPVHVLPALQLWTGAALYDADAGRTRHVAPLLGVEPRVTATLGGESTRVGLSVGWRLARATSGLGDAGRDLSGLAVGFELRDGVLAPGSGETGAGGAGGGGHGRGWYLSSLYSTRVTRLAGETVHLDGGGTRAVIGRWTLGVGGYVTRDWFRDTELTVGGGWGGLVAEYRWWDGAMAPWVGLLLGGGGIGRRIPDTDEYETAGMFVVEPSVGAAIPVFSFLRLGAVVAYRLAGCGECIPGVESTAVSGVSAGVDLRFGHFAP